MKNQKIKGVYLIGEPANCSSVESFYQNLDEILSKGVPLFQLRMKEAISDREHLQVAKEVRRITLKHGTLFFINDRPDLTVLADADGVHVGPQDLPVEEVRRIVGNRLVGISNHSYDQVLENRELDVDYFSIGPIYATTSKKIPDPVLGPLMLERCLPFLTKPVVAIGGITLERLPIIMKTGVSCVGVIGAIWSAPNPSEAMEQFKRVLEENERPKGGHAGHGGHGQVQGQGQSLGAGKGGPEKKGE